MRVIDFNTEHRRIALVPNTILERIGLELLCLFACATVQRARFTDGELRRKFCASILHLG